MGYSPEVLERVRRLNVIDDALFRKMAEDVDFCSEIISTIMERKVTVIETIPQNSIKNLQGRSVVLDALCSTEENRLFTVEVQKPNDDDHIRRARYNSSCITSNIADPGSKFENIPDVCVIFISRFDMFKKKRTVYHIDRIVRETGELCDNGHTEIYVNAKIDDGSDIAELMHIFVEKDTYNFEKFPKCSDRKKQFKMTEEGENEMCEIVEEYAREKAKEATQETVTKAIQKMLLRGYAIEEILEIYPEETVESIEKLKESLEVK